MMPLLPPFPVDDITLELLSSALDPWRYGHDDTERSSLGEFLNLLSTLGGSDPTAALDHEDDGAVGLRDPQYHPNDVMLALIAEVRRLRDVLRRERYTP